VYCQLEYLANCPPVRIQRALDELPATLDETYERTLREIEDTNSEYAPRLLLCVAVAYRPLKVEELAEILAFDFEAGPIPEFREECRLKNPVAAVLSMCSTLLALVNVQDYLLFHDSDNRQVVQFAHFSVKEFLTSTRFAEKRDSISSRYHISMTPAHTVITQACLGMLMHLDQNITRDSLTRFPLAKYAAEHWFKHARFEGVSPNAEEVMKRLFDRTKPHLSIWLWIHDPTGYSRQQREGAEGPFPPRGTPLHYAAFCGLHDIAKILATGCPKDVNSQSFVDASTPLNLASRNGHMNLARMLVDRGADVSAQDKDGRTPLHWALMEVRVDVARMLVECGADVSAQDKDGRTPLHSASFWGHVDVARMLVERGADVSVQDTNGWTPLRWASRGGHVDVARMLVESGADVSVQDKDGWTPLHWTSSGGHVDAARMLVESGADVSVQDKDGWTPLHSASSDGHVDVARMLVEHGGDVSAQDKDGRTPLHWTSSGGHVDAARMLVESGADVSAQDKDGRTPLHWASSDGHVDVARMLVESGADVSVQDKDGRTPLHWASREGPHWASFWGHVDVARMLVERGADVSAQDKHGWTPLHWALFEGHVDVAWMLVGRGADVSAQDEDGQTPLHWVLSEVHEYVAWMLAEWGTDVSAQDEDGWTLLHWALSPNEDSIDAIWCLSTLSGSPKSDQIASPQAIHLHKYRCYLMSYDSSQ